MTAAGEPPGDRGEPAPAPLPRPSLPTPDESAGAQLRAERSEPAADAPAPAPSEDVRLRDVIRRLLTPAGAGIFLSRDDLSRLGAALGFALPALDRRIMLEHLFVGVGPAGLLPHLLDLLVAEVDDWLAVYRAWEAGYPHTEPIWAAWRRRAETLRAELRGLRAEAERAARRPPA
ncbi:MAG TPA: hypothetical protein VII06_12565 [Chloroflexota bacterium]|jgi:hypothetical protein